LKEQKGGNFIYRGNSYIIGAGAASGGLMDVFHI